MHHVIGRKPGGAFDRCLDAPLNADTPKSERVVCSGEGLAMELVELTPGYVSIPQLAETLRAEGRRFARIDETLAFDKRFPWRADRQMLLCPGSFYRHPPLDDGRSLKLARIDYMVPREERYCVRLCARIFHLDQISLEQVLVVCEASFAPSFFLVVLNDPL